MRTVGIRPISNYHTPMPTKACIYAPSSAHTALDAVLKRSHLVKIAQQPLPAPPKYQNGSQAASASTVLFYDHFRLLFCRRATAALAHRCQCAGLQLW